MLPIKSARFSKAENVSCAKNRALRMASGRYIAFMDADDEMPPERMPFLMAGLQRTGADLIYGCFEIRPSKWMPEAQATFVSPNPWDVRQFAVAKKNWIHPCATLFRREILDQGIFFDESLPSFEDYEWVLEVARRGFHIKEALGPSCHIYHKRPASTAESYDWAELRDQIQQKHALQSPVRQAFEQQKLARTLPVLERTGSLLDNTSVNSWFPAHTPLPRDIKIPRTFHYIWIGGKPLPEKWAQYMQGWLDKHPGWTLQRWDESNLPPLANQEVFDTHPFMSGKGNILRYEILFAHGGVYIDTDFECVKNIEPLLHEVTCFAAWQDATTINNAILGAVPGHPLFADLIRGIPESVQRNAGKASPYQTGPYYMTPVILEQYPDVTLFPSQWFYPYPWSEAEQEPDTSEFPEAYAIHRWTLSALKLPTASVVIPTGGDVLRLEWALEGLCRQDVSDFDVIVVNDGKAEADEAVRSLVRRFEQRLQIQYHFLDAPTEAFRAGAARNEAIRWSTAERILFLDEDCVPDPDWVREHRLLKYPSNSAGIGMRRMFPEADVVPYNGNLNYEEFRAKSGPDFRLDTKEALSTHWHTCNCSAVRSLLVQLGGFDESFTGWGAEDTDLGVRMGRAGATFKRLGRGFVTHLGHPERPRAPDWQARRERSIGRDKPLVVNGGPLRPHVGVPESGTPVQR
jgi:mannosyltransferase OCH1-like enzyme